MVPQVGRAPQGRILAFGFRERPVSGTMGEDRRTSGPARDRCGGAHVGDSRARPADVRPSRRALGRARARSAAPCGCRTTGGSPRSPPPGSGRPTASPARTVVDVGHSLVMPGPDRPAQPPGVQHVAAVDRAEADHARSCTTTRGPRAPTYSASTTWPAYALITACPAELLAYVETKAIVGGTTTIQGSPPMNRPRDGWLVRNVEDETFGTGDDDRVYASDADRQAADAGRPGRNGCGRARRSSTTAPRVSRARVVAQEFVDAERAGCLQARFVAVHANAADPARFAAWRAHAGAIAWSPVLEPVALRQDHRRACGATGADHRLPRVGLGAVGHQARARRGQGRPAGQRPPRLGAHRRASWWR